MAEVPPEGSFTKTPVFAGIENELVPQVVNYAGGHTKVAIPAL
jgi:hypothetical protein